MTQFVDTNGDLALSAIPDKTRSGALVGGDIVFKTNGVERGRIKSDGTTTGVIAATGGSVSSVSSADASIAVANPTTTPQLQLATLDVVANTRPPAADWSNNSKKITSLATPTGAADAATKAYADANGPVASVFSRTGSVAAQAGDYNASQVTNAADKSTGTTQTFTGSVAAPAFAAAGLTGATTPSRYVGAVSTGAPPTSGTFVAGDFVSDTTGKIWVCVTSGTPGVWGNVCGTPTLNFQSGTAYTLAAADQGNVVSMNNIAANTLTIPTNATIGFPIGTTITVRQAGAGQTNVVGAGGVTLNSRAGLTHVAGQYGYATLVKVATDTWDLTGDLA